MKKNVEIMNKFCQSLGPSLYRGSTVSQAFVFIPLPYVPEKDKFPQAIPIKCCLVSHRPTDPFFSNSKNKIIPDSSSLNSVLNLQIQFLIYKHTILFY